MPLPDVMGVALKSPQMHGMRPHSVASKRVVSSSAPVGGPSCTCKATPRAEQPRTAQRAQLPAQPTPVPPSGLQREEPRKTTRSPSPISCPSSEDARHHVGVDCRSKIHAARPRADAVVGRCFRVPSTPCSTSDRKPNVPDRARGRSAPRGGGASHQETPLAHHQWFRE